MIIRWLIGLIFVILLLVVVMLLLYFVWAILYSMRNGAVLSQKQAKKLAYNVAKTQLDGVQCSRADEDIYDCIDGELKKILSRSDNGK